MKKKEDQQILQNKNRTRLFNLPAIQGRLSYITAWHYTMDNCLIQGLIVYTFFWMTPMYFIVHPFCYLAVN